MSLPKFTMRQLMEAGVHFGHNKRRWNPALKDYLFGVRNNIHIINLQKSAPQLHESMQIVHDVAANGGRALFVGTKRQASDIIAETAKRCGQYYVNHRWLGGMLTNWKTISNSISRLKALEELLDDENGTEGLTKKEILKRTREREKLDRALGGIKDMKGQPDILIVIDTTIEETAIKEANKLGIPVIAIIDSNAPLTGVDYPVIGNDDSVRAIQLYCDLYTDSFLGGMSVEMAQAGVDLGALEDAPQI